METKPELSGNWDQQRIKLKKKYPFLDDSDLRFTEGKKLQMLENLQVKLGKPRPELYKLIESL